jgi:pyrimidine deaminase RibD-like protein
MIMEYTHNEYCDMLLTLGTCSSRAGTVARECALRHSGQRHPDANAFLQLEQCLLETENVTCTTHVNAGRPRSVRTLANAQTLFIVWYLFY